MTIWAEELDEKLKADMPTKYSFSVLAVARGRWAVEIISQIDHASFPETRKWLASHIIDGWLASRSEEDISFFELTICEWPDPDARLMADTLRRMIAFRYTDRAQDRPLSLKITRMFTRKPDEALRIDSIIWRTLFKALGIYGEVDDLFAAGKLIHRRVKRKGTHGMRIEPRT